MSAPAADAPLSPTEVAEMKQHLAFLKTYKPVLRLQLNAVEDLLVNGQREPSERGIAKHLLAKVDRATVEAALVREPVKSNHAEKSRLLAGAVRLTGDVGVLLLYLENLAEGASRSEAAQALSEVVARIDFAELSPVRLTRLLQVMMGVFTPGQRSTAALGLIHREAFRSAFDAASDRLPEDVHAMLDGLRGLYKRAEDPHATVPTEVLVDGLRRVMEMDDHALRALPEMLRRAVVEVALEVPVPAEMSDRAAEVLTAGLPRNAQARLGLRHAARLLVRHQDARAVTALEALKKAQPEERAAQRWLSALAAPRIERVALVNGQGAGRVVPGWLVDSQREVWVRRVENPVREVQLQRACSVAGVASVVEYGAGYVAVSGPGSPLHEQALPRHPDAALKALAAMVRVLHAVSLCGVQLPDAAPARFLLEGGRNPVFTLADFDGATQTDARVAAAHHLSLWPALRDAVVKQAASRFEEKQRKVLEGSHLDFSSLVLALEQNVTG